MWPMTFLITVLQWLMPLVPTRSLSLPPSPAHGHRHTLCLLSTHRNTFGNVCPMVSERWAWGMRPLSQWPLACTGSFLSSCQDAPSSKHEIKQTCSGHSRHIYASTCISSVRTWHTRHFSHCDAKCTSKVPICMLTSPLVLSGGQNATERMWKKNRVGGHLDSGQLTRHGMNILFQRVFQYLD